jgi:NAD(P)-dependent dehydrogenase (short-subunit alcohol dehydrogenase family)
MEHKAMYHVCSWSLSGRLRFGLLSKLKLYRKTIRFCASTGQKGHLPFESWAPQDLPGHAILERRGKRCTAGSPLQRRSISYMEYPRFDLTSQVALVTGAARGLGRAISLALAHAGADIALGLRDINAAGDVADELKAMGRRVLPLQMDVRDLQQIRAAVDAAVANFGRLDILVNNAGVAPENPAEDVREEDFDLTLGVNLRGTFFASQFAGRVMIKQHRGRIINMSSQAGFAALPTESVYCMTKAAIAHLTKCLAVEWGKHNITVNAVAPTFIQTPGTESALANVEFRADVVERIAALHRIGEPMEVAGAVVFLASPAASLITGETILIDGGWTAR